jgi:hypothetical protein
MICAETTGLPVCSAQRANYTGCAPGMGKISFLGSSGFRRFEPISFGAIEPFAMLL